MNTWKSKKTIYSKYMYLVKAGQTQIDQQYHNHYFAFEEYFYPFGSLLACEFFTLPF